MIIRIIPLFKREAHNTLSDNQSADVSPSNNDGGDL